MASRAIAVAFLVSAVLSISWWLGGIGWGSPQAVTITAAARLWVVPVVLVFVAFAARRPPRTRPIATIAGLVAAAWLGLLLAGPLVYLVLSLFIPRGF